MSSMLSFMLLALLLLSISPPTLTLNSKNSFQVTLRHIDSHGNFTKLELLQRGMQRAWRKKKRLQARADADVGVQTPIHAAEVGDYLMDLSIGTPPQPYSAILDTGSDLIWTQCLPCQDCFNQTTPTFDPETSPSYSNVSCSSDFCRALPISTCSDASCLYIYIYGSGGTEGVMATETFQFGEVSVPKLGFGCGFDNSGSFNGAGIVGLGRGELSLVSQLRAPEFSYCLTSLDSNQTSTLVIGADGSTINTTTAITTPMVRNSELPSFYFLSVVGISVGETRLPIKKSVFEIRKDGSGGMIIDSGTTVTMLNPTAFGRVKKEFVRQMGKTSKPYADLEVCFDLTPEELPAIKVKKMVFHFEGGDLELPPENFFLYFGEIEMGCLAMVNAGDDQFSIFGNIHQQNTLVVYDLEKETLSFMQTQCDNY